MVGGLKVTVRRRGHGLGQDEYGALREELVSFLKIQYSFEDAAAAKMYSVHLHRSIDKSYVYSIGPYFDGLKT